MLSPPPARKEGQWPLVDTVGYSIQTLATAVLQFLLKPLLL